MKGIGIQLNDNKDEGTLCDLKIQVQRDDSGKITSGLVIGNTVRQNQALILITNQGEVKSEPIIGAGMGDALLDDDLLVYRHRVRDQFRREGLNIKTLDLYQLDNVKIDADYGDNS